MSRFRAFFGVIFALILLTTSCASKRHQRSSEEGLSYSAHSKSGAHPSYPAHPLVILDAGHGGSDEGARVGSFMEKKITLHTALMTKKHLEELGYKVIMTRSRDSYVSLARRVSIANKSKAALFVSIHFNAAKSRAAKGVEVYYCDTQERWRIRSSRRLANCVLYQLVDQTEAQSRGIKGGNFHVIRETDMPAILVEGGFVTNGEERSLLKNRAYLDRIAQGIALGVDKYFKS